MKKARTFKNRHQVKYPEEVVNEVIMLGKNLKGIQTALQDVMPLPLDEWAQQIFTHQHPSKEYEKWQKIASVYQEIASSYDIEKRECVFHALTLIAEGKTIEDIMHEQRFSQVELECLVSRYERRGN